MKIVSKIKEYTLDVLDDCLSHKARAMGALAHGRPFYFIDREFYRIYGSRLSHFVGNDFYLLIEATEHNKSYLKLGDYYRALIEAGFTRNDCLVTFGGGILQDISGFIASTLYRGIKWIFFPTTLLAQADSCIGSKTSINFDDGKNLIGTFYPPDLIIVDLKFTATLSDADFNSGLGEIIKFHLLADRRRLELLKKFLDSGDVRKSPYFQEAIDSTLEIKRSYFEADEFDTGRRNLLNYGHCFGHALESASHFAVAHGEAVLAGMGFANLISLRRGLMSKEVYREIESILRPHYPRLDWGKITAERIIHFLKKDKKRAGEDLTMILARDVGDSAKYHDLKGEEVVSAYADFLQDRNV